MHFSEPEKKQSDPKCMQIHMVLTPILSEFQERPKKHALFKPCFFSMKTSEQKQLNQKRMEINMILTSIPSLGGLGYIYKGGASYFPEPKSKSLREET